MVSPSRYLAHHEDEAERIDKTLRKFGCSGDVPGFWCIKGTYTHLTDCIRCEHDNYCQHHSPPLEKWYDPESMDPWRGDMGLRFLMEDRPLGNREDWVWLQHPEIRSITSQHLGTAQSKGERI